MSADDSLSDLSESWKLRLKRVRRSQARTEVSGMTRPPRDPVEREILREIGQEGPFAEASRPRDWPPEGSLESAVAWAKRMGQDVERARARWWEIEARCLEREIQVLRARISKEKSSDE